MCTLLLMNTIIILSYFYYNTSDTSISYNTSDEVKSENVGVSKNLGQLADSMYEWEGLVAKILRLTQTEIVAIKSEYPGKLRLQM